MSEQLERLRHLWRLGPQSAALLSDLIHALARAGLTDEAWATAHGAARAASLAPDVSAAALQPFALDRWHSRHGQAPFRAALCAAPEQAPQLLWRWRSHDPHDTFGKPLCAGFGCVALVAQNSVVGMRFERLICLDAVTGHLRWSEERRALLASAPPAWAGGTLHAPSLLWAYITPATPPRDEDERRAAYPVDDEDAYEDAYEDDEEEGGALLCIERFDLATGQRLSRAEHPLSTSAGLTAHPCLLDWGDRHLAWLLRWRSGDCALAIIDRDSGGFERLQPLPVVANTALLSGEDTFALDDTGLIQLQGARVDTLAVSPTDPPYKTLFSTPSALYLSSVEGAFMGPVHGGRWSWATRRLSPFRAPSAPSGDLYPLAASPDGEVLCAVASPGATPAVVVLPTKLSAPPVALPVPCDARTLYRRGLWMGGRWLVCTPSPTETTLSCIDARSRSTLWTMTHPLHWSQGPIPVSPHAIAAVDRDGVILFADMSDSARSCRRTAQP